jgi:hypothetical protein
MTFMGAQDGIGTRPQRETLGRAVGQGVELAVACLSSYALITQILIRVYSISREDDVLGGMWAVVATVFVYRESYQKSMSAAMPDDEKTSQVDCKGNSGWSVKRKPHGANADTEPASC